MIYDAPYDECPSCDETYTFYRSPDDDQCATSDRTKIHCCGFVFCQHCIAEHESLVHPKQEDEQRFPLALAS